MENIRFNPKGLRNFSIYYPASSDISSKKINKSLTKPVTLNINEIDPESFTGLLQNITDIGAQIYLIYSVIGKNMKRKMMINLRFYRLL
jgi:hypothetical protein